MALANPIDMATFKQAVYNWFSAAIETDVIWADQSAPRPDYPYGALKIMSGPTKYSQSWEERQDFDATRSAGQEVRFQAQVPCRFDISCQVFVKKPDRYEPADDADQLMVRAISRLGLPTVYDALFRANGIGVISADNVLNPNTIINDAYVSRAAANVAFSTVLKLSDYVGYIRTVDVYSANLGIDQKIGYPD